MSKGLNMIVEKKIFEGCNMKVDCKKKFLSPDARDARGFSLVEVLVAMSILAVGILGVMSLSATGVNTGFFAQNMSQATSIAQDRIEALQSIPFANLQVTDATATRIDLRRTCAGPGGPATRPVYTCTPSAPIVLGTRSFTWTYTVTLLDLDGSAAAVEGDGLKRLDVAVTWADTLSRTTKTTTTTTVVAK